MDCSQIWMPAILSSASGVRNAPAGDTATATNLNTSITSSWINILFVLLIGGVIIGGGLLLVNFPTQFGRIPVVAFKLRDVTPSAIGSLQPTLNQIHCPMCLSASSVPTPSPTSLQTSHSGWSRPQFPDHCEIAALELVTHEAARLKSGWKVISRALSSHFNKSKHCRRLESDNASVDQHQQAFIFVLLRPSHHSNSQHNDPDDAVSPDRPNLVSKQLAEAEETAKRQLGCWSYDPFNCANQADCKFQVSPSDPVDLYLFISKISRVFSISSQESSRKTARRFC